MRSLKSPSRLSLAAAISASLASHTTLANDVPDKASSSIDTIVVIGEKIERTLKDTTSSISVLSEEVLNSTQFKSVTDAVAEIPNVVVLSGAVPDIRGVSGNGSAGGFNSISGGAKGRVSILIDGVAEPFVADMTGDSGIWDLQQIEVYRGPQSTSNGRNSIAGSIYIQTKEPTQEWEGAVRVGYRNQDSYIDTSGVISGALVEDKLAFRLSVQRLDADTITDETGYIDNPPDYDLNKIETNRIRAKLLWTPIEDLKVTLAHSANNEQGDTGRTYYKGGDSPIKEKIFHRNIETDSNTTSLHADYQISDGINLDILFAFMDYKWGFDSYEADPATEQQLTFDETNITFDAKLSFDKKDSALKGFVGVAYFEREDDIISAGAYPYYGDDKSDSVSIYGEVSYDLTDKVTVIGGGRLEKESQQRHFVYEPIDSLLDNDTTIFLPKLVVQYDWSADTTIALSARKGYNAAGGALNFTAQEYYYFEEEKVNTFELSSRSAFADGDIFLSANVFYNDYEGYQALSSTRFIVNMNEVSTYGLEMELSANVSADLELKAGLGLLKTEIGDAGVDYPDVDGNELNSAPALTANIGAKYWLTETFNIGVSANYVDEYYADFTNTDERIAGDYSLVRLYASYANNDWLVSGYVNNALDEDAYLTREPAGGRYPDGYVAIVDPRTVGMSVTYSF